MFFPKTGVIQTIPLVCLVMGDDVVSSSQLDLNRFLFILMELRLPLYILERNLYILEQILYILEYVLYILELSVFWNCL